MQLTIIDSTLAHNLLKNILKGGRVRKQLSRSKVKLSSYATASNCQSGSIETLFFKLISMETIIFPMTRGPFFVFNLVKGLGVSSF